MKLKFCGAQRFFYCQNTTILRQFGLIKGILMYMENITINGCFVRVSKMFFRWLKKIGNIRKLTKEEIVNELEALTQEKGFIYSLAFKLRKDLFFAPEEAVDVNWNERLSYQEISFLVGLMIKHEIILDLPDNKKVVKRHLTKMDDLFQKLHEVQIAPVFDKMVEDLKTSRSTESSEDFNQFFGSGELMVESIFYGDSGAYDFQFLEFAKKKYIHDEPWIKSAKGIDIATMVTIAFELKSLHQRKALSFQTIKTFDDICKSILDIFCFTIEDIKHFGENESKNFIATFSSKPGGVNKSFTSIGAYNIVESHPIVELTECLYFLPVCFNLSKSIYESPFYWMSSDADYKGVAFKNRGETTESIAFDMLAGVFGKRNVYKDIKIYKNKKEILTDIDVLAITGNKAIIVQAKSKKLTEFARKGDEAKLRADFKEAIQKAYEQGLICRKAVIENTLIKADGKELKLNEDINEGYIICLTTDHYPAVTNQVSVYLQKKSTDPFPLAVSIFDLEILVFYLKDPFEFLYYLRQRTLYSEYFKANSEMALLGMHINQKLFQREGYTNVLVDEIDSNFPVMRGYQPKTGTEDQLYSKWRNEKFNKLINQIKASGKPRLTDAIFFLFDLPGDTVDELIELIEQTKIKTELDKKLHDFHMIFDYGKRGLTFVCVPSLSSEFGQYLMRLAMARKYKTKADTWLGIGAALKSTNTMDVIFYNNKPWEENATLEKMVEIVLKPGIQVTSQKKTIDDKEHKK